ncbi:g8182 [Coccomyxa viridis]|uniref:TBCC domain-containing protein 1 n=1 Tax=Coccomyxa viridis TaxID=1274662 RepID=A0ABP1G6G6_9CHLO
MPILQLFILGFKCYNVAGWVDVEILTKTLSIPTVHAKILVDTVDAAAEVPEQFVQRTGIHSTANRVDIYAVALYLFAQLYIRQAQRADAMDVWPSSQPFGTSAAVTSNAFAPAVPMLSEPSNPTNLGNAGGLGSFSASLEPVSPTRSNSSTSSPSRSNSGNVSPQLPSVSVHFQQQKSNHLVRKELQAHQSAHQQMLAGYTDYIKRHTHVLLQLVLNNPQSPEDNLHNGEISAEEFDRLSLLLRPPTERTPEDSSPMDTSPSPFTELGEALHTHVPIFKDSMDASAVHLSTLAEWLADSIFDEQEPAGGSVDIQGVCKSTVVRGEDDFPIGVLRVTDCHDTVVYALAPLQYVKIAACSDCQIMVGAVSRVLKVERCERVQLVAAAVRLYIASCHDCVFYLGVNRAPLLLGDNRFLQMAPYNTQYARLAAHMARAGVSAEPNLWDHPVSLGREHRPATPDSDASASAAARLRAPFSLLPPDKLLPLMVPFEGGPGPMCGGAASGTGSRVSADLGSFVGLGGDSPAGSGHMGNSSAGSLAPSPFKLPASYEEAKERKVAAVSDLRNAVKAASLDDAKKRELQGVIQSYFKDWLMASGNMRQVYDLARMERDEASSSPDAGANNNATGMHS